MILSQDGLNNREQWSKKGYILPCFHKDAVSRKTIVSPRWIHFGIGNIFRAFPCNLVQKLLDEGAMDSGIIAAEGYDNEIVDKICHAHDNYSILVTLKPDGSIEKKVIGSIAEAITLDGSDYDRAEQIFAHPSLQMASFTITEKGYEINTSSGQVLADIAKDAQRGPGRCTGYMGKIASLLYSRYQAGSLPIAMVSMDNCSHNGDRLKQAICFFADAWCRGGKADKGFIDYINDTSKVSFPWTMIDKITPRPDREILKILEEDGIEDIQPQVTDKNTYIAPFVNAEQTEYLVVQDCFPNGRPPLEKARVIFTDKNTVDKVEKMKVCTCLNPLHTALAIFGRLLGYQRISEEMKNPVLKKLVERRGYEEGLPVVVDPEIIDPKTFLNQVIECRIPNPFMPDTPARIATDTSQKLAVRYGHTIKSYMSSKTLSVQDLKMIPLVFAGWLRYLMAVDDKGDAFELSPDPILAEVTEYVKDIKLGDEVSSDKFESLYKNANIFGVNLYASGHAQLVTSYFNEMIKSKGAVDITLAKYVN